MTAAASHRVTIANIGQTLACRADETILHAALLAGVDYPYACATGNCATCSSRLESGEVALLPHGDAALNPAQINAGQTLACRARPRGDVTIRWLARSGK